VKDFLFVDAVSRTPLRCEEEGEATSEWRLWRTRRNNLEVILFLLIALIILLASWAFS
jgi:hypothetical protein